MHRGWRRVLERSQLAWGSRAKSDEDDAEAEAVILNFFQAYSAAAGPRRFPLLQQARNIVAVVRAARSLPRFTIDVSESGEGPIIRKGLAHLGRRTHKTAFVRTPLHELATVLILPETPQQYSVGPSKQTVRRKSRAAQKAGVHWATLDDVADRRRLVAMSEIRERRHPQERYRSEDVDNSRLLNLGLWLVAYSKEDVPLLMAVVPTDGEWSMLAYFRTLEDSSAASNARYLMSWILAEQLVNRGVRYLVDTATMSNLPDGLRHFQHMLGYRVVRLKLPPARRRKHLPLGVRSSVSTPSLASKSDPPSPDQVEVVESMPEASTSVPA